MVDYREILRFRNLGYNTTQITYAVYCSRHAIRDVEKLVNAKGIRRPLEEELTDQRLYELVVLSAAFK